MTFEWDENKNRQNIRKHGIDFEDVRSLFDYPMLLAMDERIDYGEERWIGVGMLQMMVAVVVFVERGPDVIRIISARKATQYEKQEYQKTFAH